MKTRTDTNPYDISVNETDLHRESVLALLAESNRHKYLKTRNDKVAGILFITSYPPRECGIATYSQDLLNSLKSKFSNSFSFQVCALQTEATGYSYTEEVKYILNTTDQAAYMKLADKINQDESIKVILIQHEFGFFKSQELAFRQFLYELSKPVLVVFHSVLPHPDEQLRANTRRIAASVEGIIVMTADSADILVSVYGVAEQKISLIPHGTHLVPHLNKDELREKYGLVGRKVLSTFGLLSSGKSIETTLDALPAIIKTNPKVVFLVIGKTHPEVVKTEGEKYRESLQLKVTKLGIEDHVIFVNRYVGLPELLEYLQLTDIYLFTTNDPNQAVSGTFVYAMSCGCPIISTPIPHAKSVLTSKTGIIIDFRDSEQLAFNVLRLLGDETLRSKISYNTIQQIVSTAWENSAVAHALLFGNIAKDSISVQYNLPEIRLDYLNKMTTEFGMLQFANINHPDQESGYTLDDNARALIATCMHYKLTSDENDIIQIHKYVRFIEFCLQPDGKLLNYVNKHKDFTDQNQEVNLEDSNGRALWALGVVISLGDHLPSGITLTAKNIFNQCLPRLQSIQSARSMAFAIKGLFYYNAAKNTRENLSLIKVLAKRLVQMYNHVSTEEWEWFENSLTYANSVLPEALLSAWLLTGERIYKDIAVSTFDFLLKQTFNENGIEVISNKNWLQKGQKPGHFGEKPIDVSYTIMTLSLFYDALRKEKYLKKMETAFNWFQGSNRLHQIIYNPCTGGCYDGLEESHVNLNQGAESITCYLMARLTVEKYNLKNPVRAHSMVSVSKQKINA